VSEGQAFGSQADFARAQGWTKSYVTALKKDDRLVFNADGLVDFTASLQRIKASTGAPERAAAVVQGKPYSDSQDRERFYNAELKRLELERETKKLRAADEVASAVDDAGALIRSTVQAWRDRLPPQLAALGADETRIAAFMALECDHLLRRMSEKFAALAASPEREQ
jgi:hypothetical protein